MSVKYDVGIIGLGLGANYGSVLTYFALHETIKAEGYSVLMVSKIGAKPGDAEIKKTHATRFAREHYDVSKGYSLETVKELNDLCDMFVIGSDQVFNYGISRNFGKAFYFDFVADDKKKISYASSFGHQIDFAPEDERPKISKLMQRFNAISVREDSGVELCRDIYNVPATQVIEPIFLLPNERYKELSEKSDIDVRDPYLLAYVLDPTPEKKAAIEHIAGKKRLKIKVILDGFPWLFDGNKEKMAMDAEVQVGVQTEDFLKLYMNSSYVLTDSFHGTSFAVKFEKPFAAIGNKRRGMARFDSLFRFIGHRNRFTFHAKKIINEDQRFLPPLDYTELNKTIVKHVEMSKDWLRDALNKPASDTVGVVNNVHSESVKVDSKTIEHAIGRELLKDLGFKPLQYASNMVHFKFNPEAWEEHFLRNLTTLLVKDGHSKVGVRAILPMSYNLHEGQRYRLNIRFRIKTKSPIINFHLYDSKSRKQVILSCKTSGNESYQEYNEVFVPNSGVYNSFMIGAVHISGNGNYLAIDYISIMEV